MKQRGTPEITAPTFTLSLSPGLPCVHRLGVIAVLLCLSTVSGCATTEETTAAAPGRGRGRAPSPARASTDDQQRFPLNYVSAQRAALDPATAQAALAAYRRMGADLERQERFAQSAIAYSNATVSARALGRLQDALDASQKAVQMAERAGDPRHLAPALLRQGETHMDLNAPQRAIPVLERAAQYARESSNPTAEAGSYIWLSRAYRRLGKPDSAKESTQKAIAVLEPAILALRRMRPRPGTRERARLWNMQRTYANALLDLGWSQIALQELDPAQVSLQKAMEVGKQIRVAHVTALAQQGLGRVAAAQSDFQGAVTHLQESLRLSRQPGFVGTTQRALGRAYRGMGKLPEAEEALRKAVAGIEDVRSQLQSEEHREAFVEDKMDAYAQLIQVLFDQGKLAEAFDMSERARARAFLDLLGNRVSLSKGRDAALIAEERALQERIAQLKARETIGEDEEEEPEETTHPGQPPLQRELDLAREAYAAFLTRVRAQSREQASLMTVEPLTLPEVQALLGPETVLLEYFVGGGRTLLWAVTSGSLRAVRLRIGEDDLTRRVSEFRDLIGSRGRLDELQKAAQDLYRTLVGPAFPGGPPRELIIVPHRVLHYLPFHASMPAPGRYLLQDSLVSYLSSASLLQFTREKRDAGAPSALAVGNPDLGDPALNLRYAEREVREVERLFPQTTVLVRKDATKDQTRRHLNAQSLIHLATHADFDEQDPLGSALLLRPEGKDTGRLEVQEIFGLDLDSNLVILSACETSLGKLTQGDEVVGLTRAFIYAGTPSVITTLWQVDDRSSYELMQSFYESLRAGQAKGEALRKAQIATLAKYPHPYYWAAYQLTGEPR
jgi:CHAT domain-containing protein